MAHNNGMVPRQNAKKGGKKGVSDNAAWRAERPGQMTVPRAELVATVRKIMDAPAQDGAR